MLIRRGSEALLRAGDGPYSLQAAIAACHAQAIRFEDTDWTAIAVLYRKLMELTPSPVVELNRAVAVSMAEGPEAALILVDALVEDPTLKSYHLLPSVRGDLLERLGRREEARGEFERAASMTHNERERGLLLQRISCSQSSP
jgi:predicted RNA polymerase sigma factor